MHAFLKTITKNIPFNSFFSIPNISVNSTRQKKNRIPITSIYSVWHASCLIFVKKPKSTKTECMEQAKKTPRVWIEKAELKSLAIIGILFVAAFAMLAFSNIFS